jgi:hypothetical protein
MLTNSQEGKLGDHATPSRVLLNRFPQLIVHRAQSSIDSANLVSVQLENNTVCSNLGLYSVAKGLVSTYENGFTTEVDDGTSFPLANFIQESESKKEHVHVDGELTNGGRRTKKQRYLQNGCGGDRE